MQSCDSVPDVYRATLKSALDVIIVLQSGVERLQAFQSGAIEEMRSAQSEIAKKIGAADSLQELQAAHSELLRRQMASLESYWSGLYATYGENQIELLNEAKNKARAVTDEIEQQLATVQAEAVPVLSAMKLAWGTAHSTCASLVRATEERVRISAAQINASSALAARQGNGKTQHAA